MQLAIVKNGLITSYGEHRELFPNVSFTPAGPDAEFLTENSAHIINHYRAYDPVTQRLAAVTPYLDGTEVYAVQVEDLTAEEISQAQAQRQAQLIRNYQQATQARLDAFAHSRGYDNIASACSYSSSGVAQYRAEAETCISLRDQTWQALYTMLNSDSIPGTWDLVVAELPELTWPK